jgi:hypothetical protein
MDGDLRKLFRKNIPEAMWVSIESGSTGAGIPDSWYCFRGGSSGWLEYKFTKTLTYRISPFQIAFHQALARFGSRSFVAVRRKNKAVDELYMIPGALASGRVDGKPDGVYGPTKWNWKEVKFLCLSGCRTHKI